MTTATPEIYISYAWRDREADPQPDDRESIVEQFCQACEKRGYRVQRDKTSVSYRDSIDQFMRAIGAGKYVLAVVSDKYLRSEYCMFEALRMMAHERFEERVFPVVLPDADIFSAEKALEYSVFWQKKASAFSKLLDEAGRHSAVAEFLLKERTYKDIHENIAGFITRIAQLNVLSADVYLENGFNHIFEALEKQRAKDNPLPQARAAPHHGALPVFPKLNIRELHFEHCLRPAQTKTVVLRLPESMNIVAEIGQGRHRFVEDLLDCGLREKGIRVVQVKLAVNNYANFLYEVARQAEVEYAPGQCDVFELLRRSAQQHRKPVLFILDNMDRLFLSPPPTDLDPAFTMDFLDKLNALKNCDFATLIISTYESVNHREFLGRSSPLWLEKIELNSLSADDLEKETARRLPDLPRELHAFIAGQLEFDPNQTHELLSQLLHRLDGRTRLTRDFIGQEIASLRKNLLKNGRK